MPGCLAGWLSGWLAVLLVGCLVGCVPGQANRRSQFPRTITSRRRLRSFRKPWNPMVPTRDPLHDSHMCNTILWACKARIHVYLPLGFGCLANDRMAVIDQKHSLATFSSTSNDDSTSKPRMPNTWGTQETASHIHRAPAREQSVRLCTHRCARQ